MDAQIAPAHPRPPLSLWPQRLPILPLRHAEVKHRKRTFEVDICTGQTDELLASGHRRRLNPGTHEAATLLNLAEKALTGSKTWVPGRTAAHFAPEEA
jgi:hypothetical protein